MGEKLKYRKHIRLKGFDYSQSHYYFVTLCTKGREELFEPRVSKRYGHELPGIVVAAGPWPARSVNNSDIVESNLKDLENKFDVDLDFYCLMPDHLHFIIALGRARQGRAATSREAECEERSDVTPDPDRKPVALPWIINAFKGWCTRTLGVLFGKPTTTNTSSVLKTLWIRSELISSATLGSNMTKSTGRKLTLRNCSCTTSSKLIKLKRNEESC